MIKTSSKTSQSAGFTLVEMLIAMVVGTIMMALIMTTYWGQARASREKKMIAEMQQNMRSALFHLARDIKLAGYDKNLEDLIGNTGIDIADVEEFEFKRYDDGLDETITVTYELLAPDPDGLRHLQKSVQTSAGTTDYIIARNFEALEFLYIQDDGDSSTQYVSDDDRNAIRAVGISLLAKGSSRSLVREERTFTPLSGSNNGAWGVNWSDDTRREVVKITIKCRNMFSNS